jgi:hypothetical protein
MMQNKKEIEFQKIRNIGEIIDDSFLLFKQHFKILLQCFLYICGPFVVLMAIFSALNQFDSLSEIGKMLSVTEPAKIGELSKIPTVIGPMYFLVVGTGILMFTLLIIFSNKFITLYVEKQEVTLERLYKETWGDFFKIFFTEIGLVFILLVSFFFLVIPYIYFSIAFSLVIFIRIYEKKGFVASIGRSVKLISKNWWRTLGLILLFTLITYAIAMIFAIPNLVVVFVIGFHGVTPENQLTYKLIFIVSTLVATFSYILYVLLNFALAFHYFSLREKKEGVSLQEKIDQL